MLLLRIVAYGILSLTCFASLVALVDTGTVTPILVGVVVSGLFSASVLLALDRIIMLLDANQSHDTQGNPVSSVDDPSDPYAFVDRAAAALENRSRK